jgi:hypothetical protein
LEKLIATYHSLNPGRETAAGNISVEAKIALFRGLVPGRQFSSADALWLVIALKTRNWLGEAADVYAKKLGLRPFRTVAEFNACDFPSDPEQIAEMIRLISRFQALLPTFPFGKPKGLRAFSKPKIYWRTSRKSIRPDSKSDNMTKVLSNVDE